MIILESTDVSTKIDKLSDISIGDIIYDKNDVTSGEIHLVDLDEINSESTPRKNQGDVTYEVVRLKKSNNKYTRVVDKLNLNDKLDTSDIRILNKLIINVSYSITYKVGNLESTDYVSSELEFDHLPTTAEIKKLISSNRRLNSDLIHDLKINDTIEVK